MIIMPFASMCYVIAGLASLGLPGLSGFVAEMTIFVGSFQNPDLFYRVLTIVVCCSIVITAVYILRSVGKIFFGPVKDHHHFGLTDATFYEKISTVVLIVAIVAMGIYPLWISNLIQHSIIPIIHKLTA